MTEPSGWLYVRKDGVWPDSAGIVTGQRWLADDPARDFWWEHRLFAWPMPRETPVAWQDVACERTRQIAIEGFAPEHDDKHDRDHALARAAACYALAGTSAGSGPFWITHLQTPQQVWPYRWEWKPKDRRANLVRAAALLLAEIERLDRAAEGAE